MKTMQDILPEMRPRTSLDAYERLFFSSVLAAQATLRENLVKTAALQTRTTEEQVMIALLGSDPLFATSLERHTSLNALHALCANAPAGREKDIAAAITTLVSADQLAMTQALHMRWLELEVVDQADGKRVYKRTDFLGYLLNAARTAAAHNIAACRRSGMICLDALSTYEYAELQRDDEGADKVDVLASYWQASLQAKAMQMMFEAIGQ